MASRVAWVDAAKGIGIVLVVIGHALGGLIDAGITPAPDWFRPGGGSSVDELADLLVRLMPSGVGTARRDGDSPVRAGCPRREEREGGRDTAGRREGDAGGGERHAPATAHCSSV